MAHDNAKAHWEPIGQMLAGLDLMGRPYSFALALRCDALADYCDARERANQVELVVGHLRSQQSLERTCLNLLEVGFKPSE